MRSTPARYALVTLLATSGACGRHATQRSGELALDSAAVHVVGTLDPSFGRGLTELEWGGITGVAIAANGDIAVSDASKGRVALLSPTGELRFVLNADDSAGRPVGQPCCVAFDSHGELWVRDAKNAQYSVFRLAANAVVFDHALRIEHHAPGLWAPTTFDRLGRLVDVGAAANDEATQAAIVRFHRDSMGLTRQEDSLLPPADKLEIFTVQKKVGNATSRRYFTPPDPPELLIAHGQGGEWADAVSSSYVVRWRDARGRIIHTLHRDLHGPELTRSEKAEAKRFLREQTVLAGRRLPFKVPKQKPVLNALFFDSRGLLWVERNTGADADRMADVYQDGRLAFIAHWPHSIRLDGGAVADGYALGSQRDELDTEHLVRVVLRTEASNHPRTVSSR